MLVFLVKLLIEKIFNQELKIRLNYSSIHGDQDEIVSSNSLLEAKDFFERNKFNIETSIIKNCGHHIPIEASSLALNFIKKFSRRIKFNTNLIY